MSEPKYLVGPWLTAAELFQVMDEIRDSLDKESDEDDEGKAFSEDRSSTNSDAGETAKGGVS